MKTEFLHIRIAPDVKAQAQKAAESLGLSVSAYITLMIKTAKPGGQ